MINSDFRDKENVLRISELIHRKALGDYKIMEVCGGQTHSILKNGLKDLIPRSIEMIHGPGCPVCVSDENKIIQAIEISKKKDVVLCTFGDMLRVPSAIGSLAQAKSEGSDIRIVYSPLDAVDIAEQNKDKQIVFFAIGFETTAPIYALSILKSKKLKLKNYSIITCMYRVHKVVDYLLEDRDFRIDALLAAGHVCTVAGYKDYYALANKYKIGIATTGFEPVDILLGIYDCIEMVNNQKWTVINSYKRAVSEIGNEMAQTMLNEFFEITDQIWHGIGNVADSGYGLKRKHSEFDALLRFNIIPLNSFIENKCPLTDIYKGILKPDQCIYFNNKCNPTSPMGAAMVSSEGICSAYYKYCLNNELSCNN